MRKHVPSVAIISLFLILIVGVFVLFNDFRPNNTNSDRAAVIEGSIEEIIYYDQDYGEIIVKCEKFHDIYRTYRFSYVLYSGMEAIWGNGTIPASELRVGDIVRIRGRGAQPNPIGENGIVGFRVYETIELLRRIE